MGDIVRRGTSWYVRFRDADGKRKMRASHQPTKELARRYLLEVEGRIARGVVGIPEPAPAAPTVAEVVNRFLSEYRRPRIKDLVRYRFSARSALRRALPVVGALRADAVQPADLQRLRDALDARYSAASTRLTLTFLATVYSWAVKAKIVAVNPVKGIEKPTAAASLEYLSKADVQALLALAEKRASEGTLVDRARYAAVHFALHTGLRRGEIFGLRWRDVDLDARRLTIARSFATAPKSGKPRHLRLPAKVVPVLAAWQRICPQIADAVVFPVGDVQPRMGQRGDLLGLPELLADIGCRPLLHPWHALRHTFASHFVMSGGNILALQRILGHADIGQTMVYAHLGDDYLAAEIDRLNF